MNNSLMYWLLTIWHYASHSYDNFCAIYEHLGNISIGAIKSRLMSTICSIIIIGTSTYFHHWNTFFVCEVTYGFDRSAFSQT